MAKHTNPLISLNAAIQQTDMGYNIAEIELSRLQQYAAFLRQPLTRELLENTFDCTVNPNGGYIAPNGVEFIAYEHQTVEDMIGILEYFKS